MHTYKPKALIDGKVIKQDGLFVAVPDKKFKGEAILIEFDGRQMFIKDWNRAMTFRKFHDKFGGKDYLLGYFKWIPDET